MQTTVKKECESCMLAKALEQAIKVQNGINKRKLREKYLELLDTSTQLN